MHYLGQLTQQPAPSDIVAQSVTNRQRFYPHRSGQTAIAQRLWSRLGGLRQHLRHGYGLEERADRVRDQEPQGLHPGERLPWLPCLAQLDQIVQPRAEFPMLLFSEADHLHRFGKHDRGNVGCFEPVKQQAGVLPVEQVDGVAGIKIYRGDGDSPLWFGTAGYFSTEKGDLTDIERLLTECTGQDRGAITNNDELYIVEGICFLGTAHRSRGGGKWFLLAHDTTSQLSRKDNGALHLLLGVIHWS